MQVGFIGIGVMGRPMTLNLLKANHHVTIYARDPEKPGVQEVLNSGAKLAPSSRAVAMASDIVITMLPNSSQVEEVVAGPHGLLEGARKGLIIIDMSTIAPAVSRKLEIFEQARPVLEAMGKKENIFHVGPNGSGEIIKLVNNVLCGAIAAAIAESFVLGVKAGADVDTMAKIIGVSTGASWQLANQFPLRAFNGSFQPGFMTDLLHKDLGLALDLASENTVPATMIALTRQMYEMARAEGYGREDYTSILKVLEQLAGVEVRT